MPSPNWNLVVPLVINNKICLCFQTSWSLISNDQRYIVCFNSIPWGPPVDMHLPTWDFICIWKWVSLTSLKLNPPTAYCPCKMAKHTRWLLLLLCGLEYFKCHMEKQFSKSNDIHEAIGFSSFPSTLKWFVTKLAAMAKEICPKNSMEFWCRKGGRERVRKTSH